MGYKNKRKALLIQAKAFLGNNCVIQDDPHEGPLEFDHIDPKTKICNVTSISIAGDAQFFWDEVAKCQLLCRKHHKIKTAIDVKQTEHGTATLYKSGCRCNACVNYTRTIQNSIRDRNGYPANCPIRLHGTIYGYKNYRCRCDKCKLAKREETSRQKRVRLDKATVDDHGKVLLYNCGCRCDKCRKVKNEYNKYLLKKKVLEKGETSS